MSLFSLQLNEARSHRSGLGTYRQVALQLTQSLLQSLYNMRVKVDCREQEFSSKRELPLVSSVAQSETKKDLLIRLNASVEKDSPAHKTLVDLIDKYVHVHVQIIT